MVYTPQLSYHSSEMIRRLSWAFGLPMTKTLETLIKSFPLLVESSLVCNKCKNKTLCNILISEIYFLHFRAKQAAKLQAKQCAALFCEIKGTTEIMLDKISA
ncbi:hypothetical protein FACS1894190_02310 [Spirochaetia bacterium]|nr:hypothetical protein FACS1894190_02310 [Spirochaetia bacterium]